MIDGVWFTQDDFFRLLVAVTWCAMLGTMAALAIAYYIRRIVAALLRVGRPLVASLGAALARRFQFTARGDHRA